MQFRPATTEDLPALKQFEQKVVAAERPFNSLIAPGEVQYYNLDCLLDSENACLLVLEDNQQLIACGYVDIRESKVSLCHDAHGYLGFMYVEPEYRGQGLNKQLMQKLVDWAQAKGVTHFYLDVYAENTSAIKAYEKLGFQASLVEMQLDLSEK